MQASHSRRAVFIPAAASDLQSFTILAISRAPPRILGSLASTVAATDTPSLLKTQQILLILGKILPFRDY